MIVDLDNFKLKDLCLYLYIKISAHETYCGFQYLINLLFDVNDHQHHHHHHHHHHLHHQHNDNVELQLVSNNVLHYVPHTFHHRNPKKALKMRLTDITLI